MIFKEKYKNKKVLITGHTGFKGSWLSIWLNNLGAKVVGLSNSIPTQPSNYEVSKIGNFIEDYRVDITDKERVADIINKESPDFIFNLAAQSLVRKSYSSPIDTFITNAIGTANILNAVKNSHKKINCIMITSDKVYRNNELLRGYSEEDIIGGKDPYSASKGMAELVIYSYIQSFFMREESNVRVATGRAGNVIGGGDWAKDRIVPDCITAWSKKENLKLRNPNSTRPWQHVLEPLSGYLLLGVMLDEFSKYNGESYNFGPSDKNDFSVSYLIKEMSACWPGSSWEADSIYDTKIKEAGLLKLDCSKAKKELKWIPVLTFDETVKMTIDWYKKFYMNSHESMHDFTLSQIIKYNQLANERKIIWA